MALKLRVTEATQTYTLLWTTLTLLHDVLAREMEQETGMAFERYRVLMMLAQAEDESLRPSELADALPITRSGVTRLIDRLEQDGIVERRSCATDGRGRLVTLTPVGEKVFRQAGRVHLRGIDEHLGASLSMDELAELRRLATKLAAAIEVGDPHDLDKEDET